jgi:Xaa-Pro dipeptidase
MLAFSITEFKERLSKTKQRMQDKGIDVLLVTDPANMNYLTGYDAWSFYVHQLLIVNLEEEQPYWIGRGLDANAARHTTWLDDMHILPYPDDYVQSDVRHPMDFVSGFLRQQQLHKLTIAVEMDAYYFTARSYIHLTKELPDAVFKDGTNLVNWIRIVKSDQEMAYIKKAATISEKAMAVAYEQLNEGVRECDVVAAISHAQISGMEEYGGDYPSIVPLLPTGEKTGACHLTWTDETFQDGQPVIIELSGCYRRYHSPLARTAVIGKANEEIQRLSEIVIEGVNAALDTVKPGVSCEEIELAWRASIDRNGIRKESRIGYSTGLNYPPDWGEHTASLRPGDKTILEPNMVFHMIPTIDLGHVGMEISESFRVTETGVEILADYPRELYVKPNIRLA